MIAPSLECAFTETLRRNQTKPKAKFNLPHLTVLATIRLGKLWGSKSAKFGGPPGSEVKRPAQ